MGIKIKKFTITGNNEFESMIEKLCDLISKNKKKIFSPEAKKLLKSIHELAKNSAYCTNLENSGEVETRQFKDRLEFGTYLFEKLKNCNFQEINDDVNLWNWLTAFYISNVFSGRATEIWRFKYIKQFFKGKRHLVRTPWILVATNQQQIESLKFCLFSPTHQSGNMCEQFISRMDLWKNPNVVQLCYDLYYDPVAERQRKGADNHRKKKDDMGREYTDKGVLFPRLYKDILILSKNKDVWDLNPAELKSMIKEEFDIWGSVQAASGKKNGRPKNPSWTRNELSLCLYYYHTTEDKNELLSKLNPIHDKISENIRKLRVEHGERFSPNENFRNPNGVWRKLRNFAYLDPSIDDDSLRDEHGSNLDKEVFNRYPNKDSLKNLTTVVQVISEQNNLNLNV